VPDGETVRDASKRNSRMLEAIMALVFIAIDPDTTGDHCPAVFAEEETGDLLFQGWTVTDPQILADVARQSPTPETLGVCGVLGHIGSSVLFLSLSLFS
jgi:hypothetical protein